MGDYQTPKKRMLINRFAAENKSLTFFVFKNSLFQICTIRKRKRPEAPRPSKHLKFSFTPAQKPI